MTAARRVGRRGVDLAVNAWTRLLVRQLVTGEWVPWAVWLQEAYELLPGRRPRRTEPTEVEMWRDVREAVLWSLSELELEATVTRTDSLEPVDLAEHPADLAGLVHVHRESDDYAWAPPIPSRVLVGDDTWSRHARVVADRLRLIPARDQIPTDLRGFCGQYDETAFTQSGRRRWNDHARAWVTLYGEPVLTFEPYVFGDGPAEAVDELRADCAHLPLVVEGPLDGAWADSCVLMLVRHDAGRDPLPAQFEPTVTDEIWHHGKLVAVFVNGKAQSLAAG